MSLQTKPLRVTLILPKDAELASAAPNSSQAHGVRMGQEGACMNSPEGFQSELSSAIRGSKTYTIKLKRESSPPSFVCNKDGALQASLSFGGDRTLTAQFFKQRFSKLESSASLPEEKVIIGIQEVVREHPFAVITGITLKLERKEPPEESPPSLGFKVEYREQTWMETIQRVPDLTIYPESVIFARE